MHSNFSHLSQNCFSPNRPRSMVHLILTEEEFERKTLALKLICNEDVPPQIGKTITEYLIDKNEYRLVVISTYLKR